MTGRNAPVALLTPVPEEHLTTGLETCIKTGFVAFGSNAANVLSKLSSLVAAGDKPIVFFYASRSSKDTGANVTYSGRFEGYEKASEAKKKGWGNHRPSSTLTDGKWSGFFLVSELRLLHEPIAISALSKFDTSSNEFARTFVPRRPVLINHPL